MLALVTGGQGFIGSHLCEQLLAAGHQVRVLARPGRESGNLKGQAVSWVRGDLTSGDLAEAVRGVDWVFHLAGALKGFSPEDLLRVNQDGTRNLVQACLSHAPQLSRFILVSSLAAAGPSPGGRLAIREEAPPCPLTWYGQSKLMAEKVVLASAQLPSVILRPPVVFGPRDRDVFSYFQLANRGLLPIPGFAERHYSLIYAPDLAAGILHAAQTPVVSGEVFHLTAGEPVTWLDLGHRIAAALGRPGRVLHLPEGLVRAAGHCADLVARIGGQPQIFSSQKVKEMLAPAWVASPAKTSRILNWVAPTDLDQALAQTVAWYGSMAGSESRPFGLTAPLGAWRTLDRWAAGYACLTAVVLGLAAIRGVPGAGRSAVSSLAALGLILAMAWWTRDGRPTIPTLFRLFTLPLLYTFFYRQIAVLWPLFHRAPLDGLLANLELHGFGTQPALAFQAALPYRWLSELFCFAYFSYYFFTPVVCLTTLVRRGYLAAERIILATSICFICCYTFFWLVPTVAPHFWFPPHLGPQPYQGYVFNHLLYLFTSSGEIPGGAFPSSHIAVALLLTLWARRATPALFPFLAVITGLMLPAVIYLHAHYLLDVPAGILTGLLAYFATRDLRLS